MDKMIVGSKETTISNDGATIIKLLDIVHPAAKSLADVAISQDNEVGDGTTSVTIFAGELLKEATSENAKAQYLEIDAGHHHTDDTLWIDDAKYIEPIQSFLTKE